MKEKILNFLVFQESHFGLEFLQLCKYKFSIILNVSQVKSRQSKFFLLFPKPAIDNPGLEKFLLFCCIREQLLSLRQLTLKLIFQYQLKSWISVADTMAIQFTSCVCFWDYCTCSIFEAKVMGAFPIMGQFQCPGVRNGDSPVCLSWNYQQAYLTSFSGVPLMKAMLLILLLYLSQDLGSNHCSITQNSCNLGKFLDLYSSLSQEGICSQLS